MNIFYLDADPRLISEMQCDKHCVKMILESAQILSTAHRILDGNEYADQHKLYKITHKNHPSSVWTRASSGNYNWHFDLFKAMLGDYTFRYGKSHKCMDLFFALENWPTNIHRGDFTPPPQCMPDEYKGDDTVQAYRDYYVGEKSGIAKWKTRLQPQWMAL